MALRLRRGTDAERLLVTPLQGELIYATDTKKIYVGDGATVGGVLVGPADADQFTELVADTAPQLGGDLDLNNNNIVGTGNINIDGTITATGNIGLGDDTSDIINVGGVINSTLRPALDGNFDLGTSVRRWNNIFAEGATFDSQVDASVVSTSKIINNASSVVYDELTDTLTAANLNGTLTGNVTGNVTGNLEGNVTSEGTSGFNVITANNATISGGSIDNVAIGQTPGSTKQNITGLRITALDGVYGSFYGILTGSVFADEVRGDTIGTHYGDVVGSDSTTIIDRTNGTVTSPRVISTVVETSTILAQNEFDDGLIIYTPAGSSLKILNHEGPSTSPTTVAAGDFVASLVLTGYTDSNGDGTVGVGLLAQYDATADLNEIAPNSNLIFATGNNSENPSLNATLDYTGNFTAKAFTTGTYANAAARDAAITSPVAGQMVFLTDGDGAGNPKFQGNTDGTITGWINFN